MPSPAVCRHCGLPGRLRRRGLCWACHQTPGVREQYPSTSVMGNRGHGVGRVSAVPCKPCPFPPGSPEKIAALEGRARLRQPLWHPDDARPAD